ncbi:MAG: glycosyltransferase [Muribaculaceae bacterium]|nr:glycosyltransferase [Muribaculaceae bacterium]
MSEKNIIVNATALRSGGALSILKQFLDKIPQNDYHWVVFVSPDVINTEKLKTNVKIEEIFGVTSLHKRLWWDSIGLKKWLKNHNVRPIATISLQNTGFRTNVKNVPNFIYYHQPSPFYPYSWNPISKSERHLWFYKNIYPLFVKLFLKKNTQILVQLDFIKKGFQKRFNHNINNIHVFSPSFIIPQTNSSLNLSDKNINLFYPSSKVFYKNHNVLFNALPKVSKPIKVYFTIDNNNFLNTSQDIIFLGSQSYDNVCKYYYACDAVLFPSYMETFGLPLLEAASLGLPIIAADLPYAREVLRGYEGVTFIPHDDPELWAKAINNLQKDKKFKPFNIENRPGWTELFNFVFSKIEHNVNI